MLMNAVWLEETFVKKMDHVTIYQDHLTAHVWKVGLVLIALRTLMNAAMLGVIFVKIMECVTISQVHLTVHV